MQPTGRPFCTSKATPQNTREQLSSKVEAAKNNDVLIWHIKECFWPPKKLHALYKRPQTQHGS